MLQDRLNYFKRIFKVYLTRDKGYLSFWHENPEVSENIKPYELGPYYQTFWDKAQYKGPQDPKGVILFDYYFDIGRQYNPLAIAQYGLGNYNLYLKTKDQKYLDIAKTQGEWLIANLEENGSGIPVWKHKFRWHYKKYLAPGWYSAHSQGTGISLLARLYKETKDERYKKCAEKAFISMNLPFKDGGVKYVDHKGDVWLEEYLITPPTHILNGYLWALWGVWDYWLLSESEDAKNLFKDCVKTLSANLHRYDAGFWSLYDLSEQRLKMIASPFYHRLHIVQLRATYLITQEHAFDAFSKKFRGYLRNPLFRFFAFVYKAIFKLFYF
jgi:hypothetical protein